MIGGFYLIQVMKKWIIHFSKKKEAVAKNDGFPDRITKKIYFTSRRTVSEISLNSGVRSPEDSMTKPS
jgi:hypothetical protein